MKLKINNYKKMRQKGITLAGIILGVIVVAGALFIACSLKRLSEIKERKIKEYNQQQLQDTNVVRQIGWNIINEMGFPPDNEVADYIMKYDVVDVYGYGCLPSDPVDTNGIVYPLFEKIICGNQAVQLCINSLNNNDFTNVFTFYKGGTNYYSNSIISAFNNTNKGKIDINFNADFIKSNKMAFVRTIKIN